MFRFFLIVVFVFFLWILGCVFVQCLLLNVFVSCGFAFIWATGFTDRHVCWLLSRPFFLFMHVRVFAQVGGV